MWTRGFKFSHHIWVNWKLNYDEHPNNLRCHKILHAHVLNSDLRWETFILQQINVKTTFQWQTLHIHRDVTISNTHFWLEGNFNTAWICVAGKAAKGNKVHYSTKTNLKLNHVLSWNKQEKREQSKVMQTRLSFLFKAVHMHSITCLLWWEKSEPWMSVQNGIIMHTMIYFSLD